MTKSEKKYSKDELKDLFREYKKTNNHEIRDILIKEHLYIAEILAKKYLNRGMEYDDLFQVASVGLIYAVDRFDIDMGYEFSSFATPTIIGEIKKHFRDKGWTIRVPRRIQELSQKINAANTSLSQTLQRTPTIRDVAKYLEVTEDEVMEAMEVSQVYSPQSLDATIDTSDDEGGFNLADLIGVEDDNYSDIDFVDFVENVVGDFSEVEKIILHDRYFDRQTQAVIAEKLDVSQMTVSRIEKKIIEKFKDAFKASYNSTL